MRQISVEIDKRQIYCRQIFLDYFIYNLQHTKKRLPILFLFIYSFVWGQNKKIDSLFTLLKTDKEDTNKINHLNTLAREYYLIDSYDTAIVIANQALLLSAHLADDPTVMMQCRGKLSKRGILA